jgi:hypothetical protein
LKPIMLLLIPLSCLRRNQPKSLSGIETTE